MEPDCTAVYTADVLEPTVTADEAYASVGKVEPLASDFSNHGRCGHWRS